MRAISIAKHTIPYEGIFAVRLEESMNALAQGDRSAFDVVYDNLMPKVMAFCRRYLGQDAHDASQEVLLRIFQQASSYRRGSSVEAWALTIAHWECRTHLRRRDRNREVALADVEPTDGESMSAMMEAKLVAESVMCAVSKLSPKDQAIIVEAVTYAGTLSAIGRKRKQRALARLRNTWRRMYGEG